MLERWFPNLYGALVWGGGLYYIEWWTRFIVKYGSILGIGYALGKVW